jgi:coenzyme Q-binding protein COQ10
MPSFATKRTVPFTAAQMYAVVADVERYPEFLPLCTGIVVKSRQPAAGSEDLVARMSVGYKTIAESFTTRVELRPADNRINVSYLDGPFKRLDNRWHFIDVGEGKSEIDFFIDYEFRSALLAVLMGAMFDSAFRKFSEAFEARARKVYGASAAAQR